MYVCAETKFQVTTMLSLLNRHKILVRDISTHSFPVWRFRNLRIGSCYLLNEAIDVKKLQKISITSPVLGYRVALLFSFNFSFMHIILSHFE